MAFLFKCFYFLSSIWLWSLTLFLLVNGDTENKDLKSWKKTPTQLRLVADLLDKYDSKSKPTWDNDSPVNVTFSMDLYQILELNEPQQYVLLNAWIIESWYDEFLYWNRDSYDNISEIRLPHANIWLPDTTLYNSLVMKDDDTRRLLNAKLTTDPSRNSTHVELLYPTIYKYSCLLDLRYFPFDIQVCTMVFSSWTYDKNGIDYYPKSLSIGTTNYIENEGWYLIKTVAKRIEKQYKCCPNKYAILKFTIYLRRKPLFYLVNLIIPTAIITLIAIVGFFTTSSASGERAEKVSLGITTLLSMSILMLMVSDQMPTTSTFIPLIGWFILGMIVVISMGTLASSVIITIQKHGKHGDRLSKRAVQIVSFLAHISCTYVPIHLQTGTKEFDEVPRPSSFQYPSRLSRKLSSFNKLFEESSFCEYTTKQADKDSKKISKLHICPDVENKNLEDECHCSPTNYAYAGVSNATTLAEVAQANLEQYLDPLNLPYHDEEEHLTGSEADTVSQTVSTSSNRKFKNTQKRVNSFKIPQIDNFTKVIDHDEEYRVSKRAYENLPSIRLTRDLLSPKRYDTRIRPVTNHSKSLKIHISMTLYQIIEVNEPAQSIKLNIWMVQRWHDELLAWEPSEYEGIKSTILPSTSVWLPDTYIYNSVVMNKEETERHMNVKLDTTFDDSKKGANVTFLWPAIYSVSCRLLIRFFPYDQQNCTLTISSWTSDKSALDYHADLNVNLANYIRNEEWDVIAFKTFRHEYKYACCLQPWVILQASLILRRKPLYYIVNLIIPTSIITIVAITGFFTPGSTNDDRTEKINLGITTLLAMSILMLMVSDQMPTTSEFVPLIAWFYLLIIIIISIGTFLTSVILSIHGRRQFGKLPSKWIRYLFFTKLIKFTFLSISSQLVQIWIDFDDHPKDLYCKKKRVSFQDLRIKDTSSKKSLFDECEFVDNTSIPMSSPSTIDKESKGKVIDFHNKAVTDTLQIPNAFIKNNNVSARRTSANSRTIAISDMKVTRQVALEWELIAVILDRILLLTFGASVIIVTFGMMGIGKLAQMHYDSLEY
uniref:Neur_chan_LBD domain-containing protein n=1 Tax=Rhabditophanes sp. KR3021 TaxID=114890 RepID=A0AC35U7J7_9BILA